VTADSPAPLQIHVPLGRQSRSESRQLLEPLFGVLLNMSAGPFGTDTVGLAGDSRRRDIDPGRPGHM